MPNFKYYFRIFCLLILFASFLPFGSSIKPPKEKGNFRKSDLVELIKMDSTFKLNIKYATKDNFIGQVVYSQARAFLQRPAAIALIKVNQELKKNGYGMVIYDGYRPWSVTKLFWDLTSEENKKFVADPKIGSKHNRGCAVDVSLYDLISGKELNMISKYDEASERSTPDYKGGSEDERRLRDFLINIMQNNGFQVYAYEWWHFDYKDWQKYRIENIPFEKIK